ncbi:PspC domain-containing protein [Flavobacterium sp. NST-5]|uniref:PspC domain-containing protein n=1 Tax=Flavobacterium ichthyis TaxID=2698827 RepID=A0ABW9Z8P6_9FLAO|nr:PspC domain-containing protein [Flavobacterium ichthyis]NBL64556.1 PspC domain-containing protein [Flavobacterium ichthyis]
MNKTVNINLGGVFFHIDEDAYQKLSRYFDAVKRSLTNSTGKDEIMKDIEMRIGEILSEKIKGDRQVVSIKDVEEIIAVMGEPEDYRIDDEAQPDRNYNYAAGKRTKKLYRDKDNNMIGGVLAGIGHYLGIDALWLRILMVILFFGFGTGLLIYLILWILMPAANTTAEKLEMTGEPVTISNIEKKVREEFDMVSQKFSNLDYDKMGNQVRSTSKKVGDTIGDIFLKIFSIIGKIIGIFLIVFSSITLVSMIIGFLSAGSLSMVDYPWQKYIQNFTDFPLWTIGLATLGAVGIPFFFLLILGLKLLVKNMKSIGNTAKYTLLALWIISVGVLMFIAANQAKNSAYDSKKIERKTFDFPANDTLKIRFKHNDYYAKNHYRTTHDFRFVQDSAGVEKIYSNNIGLYIMKAEGAKPYIQIEKQADGKSFAEARSRAEKIEYNYQIIGNELILDNYLLTDMANKYRNQEIKIYLYLPNGMYFKPDASVKDFDYSDDSFFDLWYDSNNTYQVIDSQVKCLNCEVLVPEEIQAKEPMVQDSLTVEVVPEIPQETRDADGKIKRLEITEKGVTIQR